MSNQETGENLISSSDFTGIDTAGESETDMSPIQYENMTKKLTDLNLTQPVLKLKKIMFSKKKLIEFSLVSKPVNEKDPVYTLRAKSEKLIAYGIGSSEEEAMNNAAIAFLNLLDCNEDSPTSTSSNILPVSFKEHIEEKSIEKVKLELELNHPTNLLQNFCMKRLWELPSYKFTVDLNNKSDTIKFQVECNLRNHRTIGFGSSKLSAKKEASAHMYIHFKNLEYDEIVTSCFKKVQTSISDNSKENMIETPEELNPIGLLQEICVKRNLEFPAYELVGVFKHSNNDNWFKVTCSVQNYLTTGEGRKKMLAKKDAALHMYNNLQDTILHEIVTPCYKGYQPPIKAMLKNKSQTENSVVETLKEFNRPDILKIINEYLTNLKKSSKLSICGLEELNFSAVNFLELIGNENDFNVTYTNPVSKSTGVEIMVETTISPGIIHVGSGKTLVEAKEKAANACLLFLKVLLKTQIF